MHSLKVWLNSGVLLFLAVGRPAMAHAQWTALTNAPLAFLDTCLLLTDGTVMCHEYNSNGWRRLTPDITGSYANGTWSSPPTMPNGRDGTVACTPSCPYRPLYFASAVLADGRVVVIGGEYNNLVPTWTNIGFLYDPVANAWSTQLTEAFGRGNIGDAQSEILSDGTMLLAHIATGNIEAFNPATLTFTALNPSGKRAGDHNNEEGWNILPDGRFLTVNAWVSSSFELYDPVTNTWGSSGATPVNLADTGGSPVGNSKEVGPAVLRPDGTLIHFSANSLGQNAVYDTMTGAWSHSAAMDFPLVSGQTHRFSVADGPASLLPNGHVLVMASPVMNGEPFNPPSHFFEYDGTTLSQVADTPNAANFTSYQGRMLLLPTGEVLLTAFNQVATQDVLLYSNGGAPLDAWRPTITSAPAQVVAGTSYSISGTLFNGFSEGAAYGDDAQSSTNYPLVRIRNRATGHVFYARTHDHSRMGVERVGSSDIVTTHFEAPAGFEAGASDLVVVVNGIASLPATINNRLPTTLSYTGSTIIANGSAATQSAALRDNANRPVVGRTVHFILGSGAGAQTCDGITDTSGAATCSISLVAQPFGPGVVAASFAGDASYGVSTASANTLIFAFLRDSSFVVGDGSESLGASVTFWGAQWSKDNALSDGKAPSSFKGFVTDLSAQTAACGITWTANAGGSSTPPPTVPSFIGVLVPSRVRKSGAMESGNAVRVAVIRTDPGYGPSPGQTGTGMVVAEYCR